MPYRSRVRRFSALRIRGSFIREEGRLVLRPIPDRSILRHRGELLVSTAEVVPEVGVEETIDEVRTHL
ncbi:MAG: hypothetical protein V5A22_05260 [Salinivenus sp.]